MDKYNLVLDIVGHPEKYTSEQLAEIMSDPEAKEIYNLLCTTGSAIKSKEDPDVNAEWEKFSQARFDHPRRIFLWFGSRAASVAAIAATSIVAVAAGIAVTVALTGHKSEPSVAVETASRAVIAETADSVITPETDLRIEKTPVLFENEPLEKIMKEVAETYGVDVRFNSGEAASLHLYYKFDPSLPLNEVVEQLNTFEQINIRHDGNLLTVD